MLFDHKRLLETAIVGHAFDKKVNESDSTKSSTDDLTSVEVT